MLLRTRLTLAFASAATIMLGICALVLGIWQHEQNARFDQAVLDVQRVSWDKIAAGELDRLEEMARTVGSDAELGAGLFDGDVEQMLPALRARLGKTVAIDLFDRNEQMLYTSSPAVEQESMLDQTSLRYLLQDGRKERGLIPTVTGGFAFVVAIPIRRNDILVGGIVLGQPVSVALDDLARSQGVKVALFNLRGHPVAGNGASLMKRLDPAIALRQASVAHSSRDGASYLVAGTPLLGRDGRLVGGLATLRDVTTEQTRSRLLALGLGAGVLTFVALLLLTLFALLRQSFAPLTRALEVLTALSRGDNSVRLDVERMDEAGQIAAGVARLRGELLNLEILREERTRESRRQVRIIRDELRALANTLDAEGRTEILADLEAALADRDTESGNQLAVLAFVLGRLAQRIRDQQDRLLRLVADLNEALKTKQAFVSLQQELEIARRMQQSILPRVFPPHVEVELATCMLPAKEVGGDFYDYFPLDGGRLGVAIADVSGKGVPAAFFMAISRTLLKANARFLSSPAECLARVNNLLAAENEEMMFVTVFYGVLDLASGRFVFACGGHNPPVVRCGAAASTFLLQPEGMALAVMEDVPYREGAVTLAPGDLLFLYTDGVTEACNGQEQLFGETALLAALNEMPRDAAIDAYHQHVVEAVQGFAGDAPQFDDITCVSLRYKGRPAST